jgi:hypothetical protein
MDNGLRIKPLSITMTMEKSVEPREFTLPLELQFSMRKAEIQAQEMTWDQLYGALLNLYYKRLMEWEAIKEILEGENIRLDFDVPTDLELMELAVVCGMNDDDDDDEEELLPF